MVVLELLVVLDLLELLVVVLVDKLLIGGGDVVVVEMVSGGRGVVVEVVRISELEMSRHHRLRLLLLGMENHTVVVEWEALENAATVGRWRRHDPVWLVVDRRRRGWRWRWRLEIIAAMQAPIEALAEELGGRERRLQVVVQPLGIARLERGLGGERRDGAGEEPAGGGGGGVQRVAVDELGRHVGRAARRAAGALEGRPAVDIQVAQVVLLALVQPRHVAPQRHAAGGTVRYRSRSRRRRCYRIARRIRGLGSDLLLLLLLLLLLVLVVVFGSAGLPRGDGDGHLVLGILRGARVLLDDLAERENVRLDESGGGELLLDGLRLGSHRRGGLLRGLTGTATGSAATVGGAGLGLRHCAAAATPRGTAAAAAAARAAAEAAGRRAVEIQRGGGGRGGGGVGDATHFDLLRIPLPPISLPSLLTGAASLSQRIQDGGEGRDLRARNSTTKERHGPVSDLPRDLAEAAMHQTTTTRKGKNRGESLALDPASRVEKWSLVFLEAGVPSRGAVETQGRVGAVFIPRDSNPAPTEER
ncbi:uncharacterized protein LOC112348200 [Selaginella moellendorffii]|uniref:uncharacterized protein LOC112348200 n=1 Tax=Selaginella moellendorffii TaxID=88036 RepID=UPI000D1CCBE6|nr:uncharacterized protein LOC112348200 [Selaginella moellendorffii]|eukprot:XP_024536099.1 uncharacterized protein LOC112348200 [Selaginella moellendorffii]